ncbi:unnamed protein product [Mytilus edulis]|uniref:Uncharacterized protein n=1 Tax=Mytilus edulis TaxID=6550 RepID=A0A8S3RWZ1_MYTED|nr:unnamed protein product [Mytilus edulis]
MNSVFNNFHKDPPEGTEHPEISLKGESSVLNAVRIASKALASGADEKNGVYLEFKTYLQRQQINKYEIKPFLGNRFNVVFHNAGAIYHFRSHILNFLKNVKGEGTPGKLNQLLKAVLSCLQNDTIMVGCRALGLFNKFITSPLWKILEGDIHILHMNQKYQHLVQFLEDISTDVEKIKLFMTGELVPFPSVDVKKDDIWASLVSNHNDEQCAAFLIQMCSATSKALSQKLKII